MEKVSRFLIKRNIKSAVAMEIGRLNEQIKLLQTASSILQAVSFQLTLPLIPNDIELLLKKEEFKGRGVYIISFEKPSDARVIIKQLESYRKSRTKTSENSFLKEAVVGLNGNIGGITLYVGKIKSMTFKRRLRQHLLGDQNHRTTSVRLIKWLNKSNPKVSSKKLIITLVPVTQDKLIRALEKAIWLNFQPILGEI